MCTIMNTVTSDFILLCSIPGLIFDPRPFYPLALKARGGGGGG